MIPAWSAPSLHLLYLLLLLCVLKKIKRSVLILWSNLRGRKPELSHFLNLKSKEVGAYPVSRPDRPTCTIHQQRVKEYSSRSILPCPLSPKTYPVVTFLKVSSTAMYKPQTRRLRISRIAYVNGSRFDHVVVSSTLYTYVSSYSVRASLSPLDAAPQGFETLHNPGCPCPLFHQDIRRLELPCRLWSVRWCV